MAIRRRGRENREPRQGSGPQLHVHTATGTGSERTARESRVTTEEIDSFTMRLVRRYGSAESALTHIAGEQLKYRRRAQNAEADLEELQGQLPTSEDVVLKGDEAKEYKALKTSDQKFTLAGLSTTLKELGDLRTNSAKSKRAEELTLASGNGKKYKHSLLAKLIGDTPLQFKPKLVPKADDPNETEEVQVPFVKVGDTLMSLDTWLEQEHKDLLDALKVSEEDGSERPDSSTTQQRQTVTMPKQNATSTPVNDRNKGKDKQLLTVVDKTLSTHMSPGQLRKQAAGQ
jgi:hypothetical protein